MTYLYFNATCIQNVKKTALACIFMLTFSFSSLAQGWRGIQPMVSTCEDVKQFFGNDTCSNKSVSHVFPNETVTVVFAKGGCDLASSNGSFDVRAGTITDVLIIPRYPRRLFISDLKIDKAKFQKKPAGDHLGVFEYESLELGMKFTASKKGQILDITYFPAAQYEKVRCIPPNGTRR